MRLSPLLLACLLLVTGIRTALADCRGAADGDGASYRLGKLAIGSTRQAVQAALGALRDCSRAADASCEDGEALYADDAQGLRYYLRGDTLVRKALSNPALYPQPLIGGIRAGESIGDVRVKINRLATPFPAWNYDQAHGRTGAIFFTGLCWKGAGKSRWGIALFHDADGALRRVEEFASPLAVARYGRDCPTDPVDLPDVPYSLGAAPLQAAAATLPASAKAVHASPDDPARDCDGPTDDPEAYRAFIDTEGVRYLVNLDGIIVQKELRALQRYRRPLMAGLQPGDPRDVVLRKLAASPAGIAIVAPDAPVSEPADSAILTHYCLRSSNGSVWAYELDFDQAGRLSGIKQDAGPLLEQ